MIEKETIFEVIGSVCPDFQPLEFRDQLTVKIPKDKLIEVAKALRDNPSTLFNMLTDVTAIDHLKGAQRYETVYFLYSIDMKTRLRLKVPVDGRKPHVPSLVPVYESANWYERETYDMYGIHFDGHPDMRRLYMPEDYVDPETNQPIHPLRKDFPLMGIPDSLPLPPFPEKYGEVN